MYRENNKGPRTVPCGTPDKTGAQSDFTPFTTTRCCLKQRKESIHFNVLPPIPYLNNLILRSSWGGVSNAFSKSNMNVSTCPLLSKILAQSFITVVNWVSQLCPFLNGERGGSVVECRTPEREVRGSKPTAAVLCPWARHFTPRKYWLITQEAMAPSRHDWKIVDWDVKPQHNLSWMHVAYLTGVYIHQDEPSRENLAPKYFAEFPVLELIIYSWCHDAIAKNTCALD